MLEAGVITSRFLHYVGVLSLFGAALYPLYTFRGWLDVLAGEQAQLVQRLRQLLLLAVALSFLSGVGWFVFTAAAMAGGMSQVANPVMLRMMMEATDFGPLWAARLLLTVVIGALLLRWPSKTTLLSVPLLAGLLLLSLAGTGHTRIDDGAAAIVHIASDVAHLLSAGLWLGGLWPLGLLVITTLGKFPNALPTAEVLRRFSGVATMAVAILVSSGIVNAWFLVGSLDLLVSYSYGRLLLIKVALFLLMALLAITNRFWITPRLDEGFSLFRDSTLRLLHYHVVAEQMMGITVLALVSLLGTLEPAIAR